MPQILPQAVGRCGGGGADRRSGSEGDRRRRHQHPQTRVEVPLRRPFGPQAPQEGGIWVEGEFARVGLGLPPAAKTGLTRLLDGEASLTPTVAPSLSQGAQT